MIRSASPSVYVPGGLRGPVARPRRADGPLGFFAVFGRLRAVQASGMNPVALNAIGQAIQTQEGYAPGTLAYQNNNPGNLVYAGQPGATPGAGGFAAFSSYTAGYQALLNQINLDAVRGTDVNGNPTTDISQLIGSWAPASDPANNPAVYTANVASSTGFDPSADLLSLGSGLASSSGYDSAPLTGEVLTGDDSTDFPDVDLSEVTAPDTNPPSAASSIPSTVWWIAGGLLAVVLFRR